MVSRALVVGLMLAALVTLGACSSRSALPGPSGSPSPSQVVPDRILGFTHYALSPAIGNAFVLGRDGFFYSYGYDSAKQGFGNIVRIDRQGNQSFVVALTGVAHGVGEVMTPNPDGNLYAIEQMPDLSYAVAKISPVGDLSEYPLQISDFPFAIITGSDGNLWIPHASGVVRLTTAGVVTEFDGGPYDGGGSLTGMARGTDKNVWFNAGDGNTGQNEVIRVNVADGTQTAFQLPSDATALTRGTDGNMYCIGNLVMYAVGTDGGVTTYAAPHAAAGGELGVGDQRLWWDRTDHVYGWNVKTHKTETREASPVKAAGLLTFGPDKNLWIVPDQTDLYVMLFG